MPWLLRYLQGVHVIARFLSWLRNDVYVLELFGRPTSEHKTKREAIRVAGEAHGSTAHAEPRTPMNWSIKAAWSVYVGHDPIGHLYRMER